METVRRLGAGRDLDDAIVPLVCPAGQPTPGSHPGASGARMKVAKWQLDLNQARGIMATPQRDLRGCWHVGVCAMIPTWYVTFEVRQRGILPRQRSPRETKTFATEHEAKLFARAKRDEGLSVFAGTINPHLPKRLIPSSGINAWLADEQDSAAAPGASDDD